MPKYKLSESLAKNSNLNSYFVQLKLPAGKKLSKNVFDFNLFLKFSF